ncbi:MAG: hypothetical protein LBU05_02780 [Bifidobacteriaceae bacterium]|jgi:hypothetical protein|nr:hypothetical protein [Bifidobacteriaceae bacterium]
MAVLMVVLLVLMAVGIEGTAARIVVPVSLVGLTFAVIAWALLHSRRERVRYEERVVAWARDLAQ